MKKRAIKFLKYLVFLLIGAGLFWLIYKDQDFNHIKDILKNDVNYFWVWISLLIGIISHVSRTIRWGLLIEPLGKKPRLINTFLAVMVGYLMNLVVPRMGEISRCGVLSRYEKISFTKLVGTVVVERIIDILMLLFLLLIIILLQFGKMIKLLRENPEIQGKIIEKLSSPIVLVGFATVLIIIWIFRQKFKHTTVYQKITEIWKNLMEGIKTIKTLEKKGAFIFHSLFIWLMYFLMLYVVFFCFDFTSHLNPIAGLTTFVIASFGMVAPVQGGIGAWHFMAKEALKLYGVTNDNAIIFALVAHTSMTAMMVVVGILSVITLPFVNRKEI